MRRPILVGVVLAGLVLVGLGGGATLGAGPAAGAPAVPYQDPNAQGYIGLCDQAGHQVTSGRVTTVPFAWRAVSSVAAPPPYNNAGRTAVLLAYQPQEGLTSGEWSGQALTASSRYSNPSDPMVAATTGDDSLADFTSDFAPRWDGYLQLRIYLGTADEPPYTLHYPTLDIWVNGDTWQAVDGGPVNCASGTSESIESIVLPAATTTTAPGPAAEAAHPGVTAPEAAAPGGPGAHRVTGAEGRAASDPVAATAGPAGHGSSRQPLAAGLAAVAAALLVGLVVRLRRRRADRPAPAEAPGDAELEPSTTKGP